VTESAVSQSLASKPRLAVESALDLVFEEGGMTEGRKTKIQVVAKTLEDEKRTERGFYHS
jgi:hypothetical protein